jgi:pilus assembly protein CpaF
MEKFYLEELINSGNVHHKSKLEFTRLCEIINIEFMKDWDLGLESMEHIVEIQKKAIIGYDNEVHYFRSKIKEYINEHKAENVVFPSWYKSLDEAVYHENWGLAGIAEWFSSEFSSSSSAKIIGSRIYFLEDGKMVLKNQKISKFRREQLVRAFLLLTPDERLDKDFHEIYLLDGSRVTIFRGALVKENEDVIIFRRYIIPKYSFDEQAKRNTIPYGAIPLFVDMVKLGYNIAFTGAVRTSKTTFLSTWQSYEDQSLEGLMVETDPEIPLHKIMPDAPVIQILADNEKLLTVTKNILRSDADYIIVAEARDGLALDTAIKVASKGTRRMKITFHTKSPLDFCYDVASEIVKVLGGDLHYTANKVASSFDYIFHFIQLKNKNQKRLKSIYEISFDAEKQKINMIEICSYNFFDETWKWTNRISIDKENAGMQEDIGIFKSFSEKLEDLANG